MPLFRRKPRINEDLYGKLMTSFGRTVDLDPFISGPADALASRAVGELPDFAGGIDARLYKGAAEYHLRLLAGSWLMARDGAVPRLTAEVFEEAVAWKFSPLVKGAGELAHHLSTLARAETERVD